jgi:hypothetical protein
MKSLNHGIREEGVVVFILLLRESKKIRVLSRTAPQKS